MAINLHPTINTSKSNNKRLALTKIIKIDLNKENDSESNDENIEYSPAYISTTNTCVVDSGAASQEIQFQLLGMFNSFC